MWTRIRWTVLGCSREGIARFMSCALALAMAVSCQARSQESTLRLPPVAGLDEYVPIPEDNPLTREKIELGRRLFFDALLSRDRTIACASCHQPARAFSDSARVATGVRGQTRGRNVPTLVNRAWGAAFFWDGRAASLEETVLQPIQNRAEMDLPLPELLRRLRENPDYHRMFVEAFAEAPSGENVARALASYVRTLRSGNSPLDRYRAGDAGALSPQARRGLALFVGKANCSACHIGPNLTDERFHNTGVAAHSGDPGRSRLTGRREDWGAFKTPTLREVARTAPYMHDGRFGTLEQVIEFYDRGGNSNRNLDPELRPLRLAAEDKQSLLAFLQALSGEVEPQRTQTRAGASAAGCEPWSTQPPNAVDVAVTPSASRPYRRPRRAPDFIASVPRIAPRPHNLPASRRRSRRPRRL